MDIIDIKDWGLGLSEHVLIAGPCSAESPQQIETIAKGLKAFVPLDDTIVLVGKVGSHQRLTIAFRIDKDGLEVGPIVVAPKVMRTGKQSVRVQVNAFKDFSCNQLKVLRRRRTVILVVVGSRKGKVGFDRRIFAVVLVPKFHRHDLGRFHATAGPKSRNGTIDRKHVGHFAVLDPQQIPTRS